MGGQSQDFAQQAAASLWTDPFLGGLAQANAAYPTPARSNVSYLGIAGHVVTTVLAASGGVLAVPLPALPGDVFTTLTLPVGSTAGVTPTHQVAGIYSASGALIQQSVDGTNTAIPASAPLNFALLAGGVPITAAEVSAAGAGAPGFVWAAVSITAGTVPTAVGVGVGSTYKWVSTMPTGFAVTFGSAVGGVLPATIVTPTVVTAAPFVVLS
jgi:hypothetical protein